MYYLGGGGVGGPIVRNKTFFFFAAENYHDVQSRSVSTAFPTAAERTGDFSRLTNSAGQPVTIYDPLTRQPFPGNIIPANRINPVAAAIAGYLPLPDVDRRQRHEQLHADGRDQQQLPAGIHLQGRAQVQRPRCR